MGSMRSALLIVLGAALIAAALVIGEVGRSIAHFHLPIGVLFLSEAVCILIGGFTCLAIPFPSWPSRERIDRLRRLGLVSLGLSALGGGGIALLAGIALTRDPSYAQVMVGILYLLAFLSAMPLGFSALRRAVRLTPLEPAPPERAPEPEVPPSPVDPEPTLDRLRSALKPLKAAKNP
jgi:hypothetical protein